MTSNQVKNIIILIAEDITIYYIQCDQSEREEPLNFS